MPWRRRVTSKPTSSSPPSAQPWLRGKLSRAQLPLDLDAGVEDKPEPEADEPLPGAEEPERGESERGIAADTAFGDHAPV